ncbi:MAG: hypothetical protein KIT60_15720 [Burkholderiaceae bacterium]|nr:hypothetical protein [Burkholderiaceae bacterium]
MERKRPTQTCRRAALALLAMAVTQAASAESGVVWVDNEHFGFTSCRSLDDLPGSQDPKELMNALRERGLSDAYRWMRARGLGQGTITLTPVSGSIHCEGSLSSMVFRIASHDGASGRSWTGNLVSRLPAPGVPSSGLRSKR